VPPASPSAIRSPSGLKPLTTFFTNVLAVLLHKQLLSLNLVAQDGTRVRADASAPSFRRAESLQACREQAQLHLRAVLAEDDDEADLSALARCARPRRASTRSVSRPQSQRSSSLTTCVVTASPARRRRTPRRM
jgi:hypothetical protein